MTAALQDAQTTRDAEHDDDRLEPGIYPDLDDEAYYALGRPGSTAIKHAAGATPAEYAHWVEENDGPSEAQRLGQLIHEAILEPDKWRSRPPSPPHDPSDMYGKSGEAARMEAEGLSTSEIADTLGYGTSTVEKYRGKEPERYDEMVAYYREHDPSRSVSEGDCQTVEACRDRVHDLDEAAALLDGARTEVVALATVEGIPCRAKFDALTDEEIPTPVDLKTTRRGPRRSASRDDWGYVVGDCGYHVQAGAYLLVLAELLGIDPDTAIDRIGWQWIAVETDPPHLAAVHRASRSTLEAGMVAARDGLETIRAYREGDRSGYPQQGKPVSVPDYLLD